MSIKIIFKSDIDSWNLQALDHLLCWAPLKVNKN